VRFKTPRNHPIIARLPAVLLILLTVPVAESAAAQLPDPGIESTRPSRFNLSVNGGRGLVQAVSPETLASGEVAVGAQVMNYDRNPGDIDFFEYSLQVAVGIGGRTELFVKVPPWLRTTSVYQEPVRFPVPPLDIFVDTHPTSALRDEPYFMFSPEVPYKTYNLANRTAIGAHSRSSGDGVVGLKVNLLSESRGDGAGVGVRGFVEFPTETPRFNAPFPEWRDLAGVSGEIDFGFEFLFARTWKRTEILANAGYKRVGDPERGLRMQWVDSSQTDPAGFLVGEPVDFGLDLPDELRLSAGLTVPAFRLPLNWQWWALAEFNHKRFVGSSVPVERFVHPAELSLGLQTNVLKFRSVSLGAAWQLLLNDAGRGGTRTTRLQAPDGSFGDIHFGELVDPGLSAEVREFFLSRGATFTDGSSKVFSTNNPAFDSWRNVPVDPAAVRFEGAGNVLVFVTWRVGGPR